MNRPAWMADAACASERYNGFTEWDKAQQVHTCSECPVRRQCRELGNEIGAGGVVYGGRKYNRREAVRL